MRLLHGVQPTAAVFRGQLPRIGRVAHEGAYPGEHEPIISKKLWDAAQAIHAEESRAQRGNQDANHTGGLATRPGLRTRRRSLTGHLHAEA